MMDRRKFLRMLGLAPAAAVAAVVLPKLDVYDWVKAVTRSEGVTGVELYRYMQEEWKYDYLDSGPDFRITGIGGAGFEHGDIIEVTR